VPDTLGPQEEVDVELIQKESLVDVVAARLRDAILSGSLRPGEPVRVKDLQERMGVSHIPIREAIRQIEAEGLIIAPPRRTPVVAGVALDDLTSIYELRRMIELPTAELSRRRARDRDVQRVRDAFAAFENLAAESSSPEYWRRHTEFHWALLQPGANSWTRRSLEPLWAGAERYVRLFVSRYTSAEYTMDLHRLLVDAYESGDPVAIVRALDEHFVETERVVREGFHEPANAALTAG
jgi:DNA-binding GntR family transcriptional regulator